MAPKRNNRSATKSSKISRRNRNTGSINTSSTDPSNANAYETPLVNTSSANANVTTTAVDVTQANTAHNQLQQNNQGVYTYFERPWEQQSNVENYLQAPSEASPMERWMGQNMLNEPWQNMEGVFAREEQTLDFDVEGDVVTEDLVREEDAVGSMLYMPRSEKDNN